jgi:LuxR family maltose regulon positive regulatory protein
VSIHILPTKFYTPARRSNLVGRPRLLERLEAGTAGKLTLVSAPAGYGKSTLLSEWVQQTKIPVAWLSLDEGDNDPVRFWAYFVSALQRIKTLDGSWDSEPLLDLLQAAPIPEGEAFLTELLTRIASIHQRFILILDDYHAVTETQIQDGLIHLLEGLPSGLSGLHLVISSRSDPPWPLARLRVREELSEVRAQDLRFTQDEADQFLNEVMGLALSPEDMAALESRTEGWAAGLQMAAISMRDRDDKTGFIQAFTGSHRYVIDYLMEEVLGQQTPEVVDFLLKTSILERMNSGLCAAVVSGSTPAPDEKITANRSAETIDYQAILESLEHNNLFLTALDDQRNWYRYHRLFAGLLQNRLQARAPGLVPEMHRRASQWYGQSGFYMDAIKHALKSEDWAFAAEQLEAYVLIAIQHGEIIQVRHWMRALPDEIIRARPILCIAQAWGSARHANVELIEELLAQAEAALAMDLSADGSLSPENQQLVSNQVAVLQVVIARARGDPTHRQQALAQQALERVSLTGDTAARATLLLRLGFCYLDLGKDEQADRLFAQATEHGQSSGNYYAAYSAAYGRMVIARRHGRLHDLAAICRYALEMPDEPGSPRRSLAGIALIMLGDLYYEWNKLAEAESALRQGLELVENVGMTELRVKIAQGNFASLPDFVRMAEGGSPELVFFAASLQAQLHWLLAGECENSQREAFRWAGGQALDFRGQPTYDWEVLEKLILARILCSQYRAQATTSRKVQLEEVFDFIAGQRQSLEALGWNGTLVELYVVMAMILRTLGRGSEALTALEGALRLAEPHGFVRTFVDAGEPVRDLIQQARDDGGCAGYSHGLLLAFSETFPTEGEPRIRPAGLVEALRPRELQVLRLLNSQLNVPEIAHELHLAPTTVRTHVQNIYGKLGVHSRLEALHRAKDLGLL